MYNNIPIYEAVISREIDGIFGMSLVDDPAVESNFVAFSKEKQPIMFSIDNVEKHMVTGVVMRANYPIIRKDENDNLFYLTFSPKTIEMMAQRLFSYGAQNNVDLSHSFQYIEGVEMVECYIKNSAKGISPRGFEDITDGSLFATYHIEDENVWNAVKDGTFKGFSLEGYFSFIPTENNEINNIKTKMSKLFKTIKRAFVSFAEVKTDKGVITYAGDEDLKAGDEVFVDVEGEAKPAEDGEYKTEDGKVIVVAEGKVAEIKDADAEVAPTSEEPVAAEGEEPATEEAPATEEPKADPMDEMRKEIEALKADIEEIKKTLAELVEKPAAEPVEEEFEKVKAKDAKMSKAERLASYLK